MKSETRKETRTVNEYRQLYDSPRDGILYSHLESPGPMKTSDQTNVAVWEKELLELAQDALVPNTIERLLDIKKERGHFTLAAGFHPFCPGGKEMRFSKTKLFEDQLV